MSGKVFAARLAALVLLITGTVVGGAAWGQAYPGLNFTLEGCRNNGSIELPDANGAFICPTGTYTTGNLGKGWNELDLVPFRVTISAGNSAPDSSTYTISLALDHQRGVIPGYDVISSPVLNASLSDASCPAGSDTGQLILDPGIGSADLSIYRMFTVTGQAASTTCVYDYYGRLAIGASQYPGSSLHSNLLNSNNTSSGIGQKDVPIPVKEILPQELRKDMAATRNADYAWNLTKEPTPANVTFVNTCDKNESLQTQASIRIEWSKIPAGFGEVLVITNVYAKNPASRIITVDVTDTIYGNLGAGEVMLDTATSGEVDVPANTEMLVLTHSFKAPSDVTGLNDVASATYTDKVTSVPVPGTTSAIASADVQDGGDPTNATAVITDKEWIIGANVDFSVDTESAGSASGSYADGYVKGTFTTGPVEWESDSQDDGGFVEFNKTIRVAAYTAFGAGTRKLKDKATLNAIDGFNTSASASIGIAANAYVELVIRKTIPDVLQGDESVTVKFEVKDSSGAVVAKPEITFAAGEFDKKVTVPGLLPDNYTIIETDGGPFVPVGGNNQTKDLRLPNCFGEVTFTNEAGAGSAIAQVKKVTDPAGYEAGWAFELDGPGATGLKATTTDDGYVTFEVGGQPFELLEGDYTITETLKSGWRFVSKSGCEFKVDYPADYGQTFQCVYTNEQLGKVKIRKFVDPTPDNGAMFGFTDNIAGPNHFALGHSGVEEFIDVPAGNYTVTEDDPRPDFDLTLVECNDANSTGDADGRQALISLEPGESVTCDFYNTERGKVTVLKTSNGVVDPTKSINFRVSGPGSINVSDNTLGKADGLLDFGGVKLIAGETYTVCESPVPAGWTSYWEFPEGTIVTPYNPNATDVPPEDLGVRCYDFEAKAGQTAAFVIDNSFPGGDGRTPGYWKNWNTCTGGNQPLTAASNGGAAEGFYLLDDLLPQLVGKLDVTTCPVGVAILDKREVGGRGQKKANDAAYNLAAAFLAAKLNLAGGAYTCQVVQDAVVAAQALLDRIKFIGIGNYLTRANQDRATANSLANTLDMYNNNLLCQ